MRVKVSAFAYRPVRTSVPTPHPNLRFLFVCLFVFKLSILFEMKYSISEKEVIYVGLMCRWTTLGTTYIHGEVMGFRFSSEVMFGGVESALTFYSGDIAHSRCAKISLHPCLWWPRSLLLLTHPLTHTLFFSRWEITASWKFVIVSKTVLYRGIVQIYAETIHNIFRYI